MLRKLAVLFVLWPMPLPASASIAVMCQREQPRVVSPFGGVCDVGDRLFLRVSTSLPYVSLVAQAENGAATWLYTGVRVPRDGFVPVAPEISESHPKGETMLLAVFSREPLDEQGVRAALRRGGALVVRQKILIVTS